MTLAATVSSGAIRGCPKRQELFPQAHAVSSDPVFIRSATVFGMSARRWDGNLVLLSMTKECYQGEVKSSPKWPGNSLSSEITSSLATLY